MSETNFENSEKREFRAEVRKVLSILTNSLYTNREIFLRELISNASDALDKVRFRVNRGELPRLPDLNLEIHISLDKDNRTLAISDTGLGMRAEELAENLGTIAKSGSEDFLASLAADSGKNDDASQDKGIADASNIIGRFGVGFYSVFMVADKVEVISRPAFAEGEPEAYVWTSDGLGTYTIDRTDAEEPRRGTVIRAHLKDNASEFLEPFRIQSIIRKHSAYVPFPIFLDGEQINTQPALWREPKTSISKEQYDSFYTHLTYDNKAPLDVEHISVDAPTQFTSILYIPDSARDFFGAERDYWGLDLYARRVLIQHNNKEILPEYLAFLRGIVDTEDLPLNISRETLQENLILRRINQVIVKQVLGHLEKMARDDTEKYNRFWQLHGKIFKLGYHDYINRDRIASLLRFNSSALPDGEHLTSLEEYKQRAPETQKAFWYVAAPNREACRLNPHMELFRKKGIEVLFLFEPIDEFVMDGLGKFQDWDFKAIETAGPDALKDFPDKEKPEEAPQLSEEDAASFDALLKKMKEILGEKVTSVTVSHRLAESPAVLVAPDGGMTASMEKLFKVMQHDDSIPVKIMEVNRDHPLLRSMLKIYKADDKSRVLSELVAGLFDSCLLVDGYLKDPQALAGRQNELMTQAAGWYTEICKL